MELEFFDYPDGFLSVAAQPLAADPVVSTVVAAATTRLRDEYAAGVEPVDGVPRWWVVVRDGHDIVGLGMRTAPAAPHPPYLLPMPGEAARLLARELHGLGQPVGAVNGVVSAVRESADETARLTGGGVAVGQHARLFEAVEIHAPSDVPGRLRAATVDDVDLVTSWLGSFMADADEQAGRPRGTSPYEVPDPDDMLRRIQRGTFWCWVDRSGDPVNLTSGTRPSFGVSRVGPVYTPVRRRGRGYASAAVAAVSRSLLDEGARCVSSPTRPTRPRTGSTSGSATARSSTPPCSSSVEPSRVPHDRPATQSLARRLART